MTRSFALLLLWAAVLGPEIARAQERFIAPPGEPALQTVEITRLSGLDFDGILAGADRRIAPTDPRAAKFEVSGPPGARVIITIHTPEALRVGSEALPIDYGATSGARAPRRDIEGATFFDPGDGFQATIPPDGTLYVWIGARVRTRTAQRSGRYRGIITLSAAAARAPR